jgi:hypothetical protein
MPATRAKSQNTLQEAFFVGFRYNEVDHILILSLLRRRKSSTERAADCAATRKN